MKQVVFSLTLLLASACCPGRNYKGDGKLVAKGCWPFANYEVNFPLPRPHAERTWTYRFSGVPAMRSTAGFTLISTSGMSCVDIQQSPLKSVNVSLEAREVGGRSTAVMNGPLERWLWSYAGGGESGCYVYAQSLYFTPREDAEYEYRLALDTPWPPDLRIGPQIGSFAIYAP